MIGLIARYTRGTQAKSAKIRTARAARYAIAAPNGGLVVHADGETICVDGSSLLVECLPARIRIMCRGAREAEAPVSP